MWNPWFLLPVSTWPRGYLPSVRTFISDSRALKSSETLVLTSPPIRSPAHCLNRSIFRFILYIYAAGSKGNANMNGQIWSCKETEVVVGWRKKREREKERRRGKKREKKDEGQRREREKRLTLFLLDKFISNIVGIFVYFYVRTELRLLTLYSLTLSSLCPWKKKQEEVSYVTYILLSCLLETLLLPMEKKKKKKKRRKRREIVEGRGGY